MKKLLLAGIAAVALATTSFAVTFNLGLDAVRDSGGSYVSTSTLALIIVDSSGNGFSGGVAGSLSVGSAFNGSDDYIAWRGDFSGGDTGVFSGSAQFNIGTIQVPNNAAFAIVWLPGLSIASLTSSASQSYGLYTSTNATQFGSDTAWVVGANNSGVYTVNVFTATNTGSLTTTPLGSGLNNSVLTAGLTVSAVPEPATYAGLFGLAALGFCAVRRRRKA